MDTPSRSGPAILGAALALGIAADALLRAFPPGINASLWLCFLASAVILLARRLDRPLVGQWRLVALPVLLCAAALSLRDSPALFCFNAAAAIAGCLLIATRTSSRGLRDSTMFELAHALLVHMVHAIAGAGFLIAREVSPPEGGVRGKRKTVKALLRGTALAVPFVLLFGSLFAAADASFDALAGRLFDVDLSSLFIHLLVTSSVGWTAAGFLRGSLSAEEVPVPASPKEAFFSAGIVEIGVFMTILDSLFLLFVALQFPYLFGGAATIAARAALTYAEYARRGFFELTAVACFSILTLLLADWMLRKDSRRSVVLFRSLAGVNLILLGTIMASAWQRLILYQSAYGLTEARLYAAAALTGTGLVAAWFALSVLAGRRSRFVFGSIVAAYAVILALDLLNPDALIARIDIARGASGKPFDPAYIATLSADAAPELLAGLPLLQPGDRGVISRQIIRREKRDDMADWRSWNYSRSAAEDLIQKNMDMLILSEKEISQTQN